VVEYQAWSAEPCMTDCKDEVRVTMRSVFLVETPPEGGSESIVNPAMDEELPSFTADGPSFIPAAVEKAEEEVTQAATEAEPADDSAALAAAGKKVFGKCKACHQVGAGAKNGAGPALISIVGSPAGQVDGFKYSKALMAAAEGGLVWTEEELAAFLAKPRSYMKGTAMSFAGLRKDEDIAAIIAYLKAAE